MAALEDLQAQRQKIIAEIQRRGGKDKAPGFTKQLNDIDAQIRQAKGGSGIMTEPPTSLPATTEDKFTGLSNDQARAINQAETADVSLGSIANNQLNQIAQNYSQPIDYSQAPQLAQWNNISGGPQAPTMQSQMPGSANYSGIPQMGAAYDPSQGPQLPSVADYSQGPGIAGTGNFNDWRQQQIDATTAAFDSRFDSIFSRQQEDLEQKLYNEGVPRGSEKYNEAMASLQNTQADQRLQNYSTAMNQAGTNASQFADIQNTGHQLYANDANTQFGQGLALNQQGAANQAQQFNQQGQLHQQGMSDATTINNQDWAAYNNQLNSLGTQFDWANTAYGNQTNAALTNYQMGNQARQDWINDQNAQRNQPLVDFNSLRGSISSMPTQNLGYSQGMSQMAQQQKNTLAQIAATPRGGGGGGGGSQPLYAQNGFGSYQDYAAFQSAMKINEAQQLAQINAQYQNGGNNVNPLYAAGGQALGIGLGTAIGYGLA